MKFLVLLILGLAIQLTLCQNISYANCSLTSLKLVSKIVDPFYNYQLRSNR